MTTDPASLLREHAPYTLAEAREIVEEAYRRVEHLVDEEGWRGAPSVALLLTTEEYRAIPLTDLDRRDRRCRDQASAIADAIVRCLAWARDCARTAAMRETESYRDEIAPHASKVGWVARQLEIAAQLAIIRRVVGRRG